MWAIRRTSIVQDRNLRSGAFQGGSEVAKHLLHKFEEEAPSIELRAMASLVRGEPFTPSMTYTMKAKTGISAGARNWLVV
jgi:hypothetical protein